jgi:hypothetical protein
MNQRLRRTVLNTLLRATFLRKRLSNDCWLSPGLNKTLGKRFTPPFYLGIHSGTFTQNASWISRKLA